MNVTYCEKWFRYKKRPTDLMDEDRARKAHDGRLLYTIVLGDLRSPECFVEINNDYVGVGFLDDHAREYLSYSFEETRTGRLFLTMATHRTFDGQTDKVVSGTTYYFKEDGVVTIENENLLSGSKSEGKIQADISGNWEEYPKFGQYTAVTQINRQGTALIH